MNKIIELNEKDIAVCSGGGEMSSSKICCLKTSALVATVALMYFGSIRLYQIYHKRHLPIIYKRSYKTPGASYVINT